MHRRVINSGLNSPPLATFSEDDVISSTVATGGTTAGGIDCCIGIEAKDGSTLIGHEVKDVSAS